MSDVLNRSTKRYVQSVNTPDYSNISWIINPDISLVISYPIRYWKVTGDIVSLMNKSQRDAVDAEISATEKNNASNNLDRVLKAVVLSLNDGSFVPNSGYTNSQLKNIIKAKL